MFELREAETAIRERDQLQKENTLKDATIARLQAEKAHLQEQHELSKTKSTQLQVQLAEENEKRKLDGDRWAEVLDDHAQRKQEDEHALKQHLVSVTENQTRAHMEEKNKLEAAVEQQKVDQLARERA